MFILVDLTTSPAQVTLEEPDDVKRFHVGVAGGPDNEAVDAALREAEVG